MFIVKELENSDARCGCVNTNFADIKSAQDFMRAQFEKSKNLLGGTYAEEEQENICSEEQQWATISPTSAHIQVGLDAYDWEIEEDSKWVSKEAEPEGFIVYGCTVDNENGNLIPFTPVYAKTEDEAKAVMKKMYLDELANRGLADNNACDEQDAACPGGCLYGTGAEIWDFTEYAFNCLVNVVHFSYCPISSKKDESV